MYRFVHNYEGMKYDPIIFIYSMPGFGCSIKERMLYSSCKSEIIQYLRNNNVDVVKTFEISEASEITNDYLLDEFHPKVVADTRKFSKPQGPQSRGPRRVTRPL